MFTILLIDRNGKVVGSHGEFPTADAAFDRIDDLKTVSTNQYSVMKGKYVWSSPAV
jgi:hypothetical protein